MEKINTVLSTEDEYCTAVFKIHNFSGENICQENQISPDFIQYETSSDRFRLQYETAVFLIDDYISIVFRGENSYAKNIDMTCIVAVVDDEGKKRFTQSFQFYWNRSDSLCTNATIEDPKFVVEKCIGRKRLLNEPAEFLPNDILTICTEIQLTEEYEMECAYDVWNSFVKTCFKSEEGHSGGAKYFLFLDSLVAERLREESRYFKRILVTPMEEKRTRYMGIPDEEYQTFLEVGCILLGANSLKVKSIDDVFRLYAFADKYDIPCILNVCRFLMKSCLSVDNVSEISSLADMYNDCELEEIVKDFQENYETSLKTVEGDFYPDEKRNGWNCDITEGFPCLHFKQKTITNDVRREFDFYH